jgi:hypothetical protein
VWFTIFRVSHRQRSNGSESGIRDQGTEKLAALRAGGGGKTTRLYVLIAGCRGIIPLPGRLRGSAPQGFDFEFVFPTPLRGHKRERESQPPETRRGTTDPRRGVRGERGQRPRPPRECEDCGTKVCARGGKAWVRGFPPPSARSAHDSLFPVY